MEEMKIFMEEMKEVKEIKLKIEKEIREKETIKFRSLCEKEREIYLEELKQMKELAKKLDREL